MTFELRNPTTVKLVHAKGRKEHHGEAKVLALDLSITWTTNNRSLAMFDEEWRQGLFLAVPPGSNVEPDQGALDLAVSDLPFMRLPKAVYPIKSEYEFEGHTLRLDYGRGGDADKVVSLCKLKSFHFTPIEGGSVEIHFSLSSAADISGDIVGIFSELIQQDIVITLLAAAVVEDGLIDASSSALDLPLNTAGDDDAEGADDDGPEDDATAQFIDRHAPAPTH